MNPEINLHSILSNEFLQAGYAVIETEDGISLPTLDLTIEAALTSVSHSEKDGCSVVISVCCKHAEKFPGGIKETALSFGENINAAAALAFNHWIATDFPPIHDYLCHTGNFIGNHSELASHSGELNEFIGWDCFLGPLLTATQRMNIIETNMDENDQYLVYRTLFQAMTDALLATPGLYYIRAFMSKIDNKEIDCDCRVNGVDWDHGKDYLADLIKNYDAPQGVFYIKQNILLVSKDINKIQSKALLADLNKELSKQKIISPVKIKKWWQFWI